MAELRIGADISSYFESIDLAGLFDGIVIKSTGKTHKLDLGNDVLVVIRGSSLEYREDGTLKKGRIDSIELRQNDDVFFRFDDMNTGVAMLLDVLARGGGLTVFKQAFCNDTTVGGADCGGLEGLSGGGLLKNNACDDILNGERVGDKHNGSARTVDGGGRSDAYVFRTDLLEAGIDRIGKFQAREAIRLHVDVFVRTGGPGHFMRRFFR